MRLFPKKTALEFMQLPILMHLRNEHLDNVLPHTYILCRYRRLAIVPIVELAQVCTGGLCMHACELLHITEKWDTLGLCTHVHCTVKLITSFHIYLIVGGSAFVSNLLTHSLRKVP